MAQFGKDSAPPSPATPLAPSALPGALGTFIQAGSSESPHLKDVVRLIFLSAAPGLTLVEARIRSRFVSEAPALREIASYLLELGGKRVRPILALLAARLFGMEQPSPRLVDAASGIELIHMATLLHDDIIDQSPLRRNKESAFVKYGFTPSLLAGDFLWVRAFGLCAHLGKYIVSETEKACVELTEGEVLEGHLSASDEPPSLVHYENVISKKTAALFALSTAVGAHCAEASPADTERLKRFGHATGVAFQMVDDILDVVASSDLLGKPSGTDLRQKTPSLVNILWLRSGDPAAKRFFALSEPSTEDVQDAVRLLSGSEIIEQSRERAKHFAALANTELLAVEDSRLSVETRDQLLSIVDFTLQRCL